MSENTNLAKLALAALFMLITAVGITALMFPVIDVITNFLVSLTWYQAGIAFSVIGLIGLYILYKTGAMSK